MKTKIIPFDLETAKKIQAGEIAGKMYVSDDTHNKIRIICTDRKSAFGKIVALEEDKIGTEGIVECNLNGEFLATMPSSEQYATTRRIVLEVPDNEPQFKPFDKVLVRQSDKDDWRVAFYSHFNPEENIHVTAWLNWYQCIPYEGNEMLVGTTDKPKEE